MFEKLISMLTQGRKREIDLSIFRDELANKTEWTPLVRGGANFKTHKLVTVDMNRIEFRASLGSKLFAAVFFMAGIGVMFGVTFAIGSSEGYSWSPQMIFPIIFGGIFAAIGVGIYYFGTIPRCFDKNYGYYWKGRDEPNVMRTDQADKFVKLSDIHALQIVSEWVRGNKTSYTSYELNLVLKDGKRINVVDHGNLKALREDARITADFLGIQVWDSVNRA